MKSKELIAHHEYSIEILERIESLRKEINEIKDKLSSNTYCNFKDLKSYWIKEISLIEEKRAKEILLYRKYIKKNEIK